MAGSEEFRRRSVTAVRNEVLNDPALPLPALGVLIVLLAMPGDAPLEFDRLPRRGLSDVELREALGVLEARGYLWRFEDRGSGAVVDIVVDDPLDTSLALHEASQLLGVWMSELRRVSCAAGMGVGS